MTVLKCICQNWTVLVPSLGAQALVERKSYYELWAIGAARKRHSLVSQLSQHIYTKQHNYQNHQSSLSLACIEYCLSSILSKLIDLHVSQRKMDKIQLSISSLSRAAGVKTSVLERSLWPMFSLEMRSWPHIHHMYKLPLLAILKSCHLALCRSVRRANSGRGRLNKESAGPLVANQANSHVACRSHAKCQTYIRYGPCRLLAAPSTYEKLSGWPKTDCCSPNSTLSVG